MTATVGGCGGWWRALSVGCGRGEVEVEFVRLMGLREAVVCARSGYPALGVDVGCCPSPAVES